MEILSDCQMREEDSNTPVRHREVSVSFGRFENDLLSWEKWSSFSQNKYLEEVEKCATPGSVAAKKAFFEARNKLIAVRKVEVLNKHLEVCQESEETHLQNMRGGEVDLYDEEIIEENLFGSEMSSPGMNEHPVLETCVFIPQEPDEKDDMDDVSANQFITNETIHMIETSSVVVDFKKNDSTLFISDAGMLNNDNTDENTNGSNSEFGTYDGQSSTKRVQEEQLSNIDPCGCETDKPFNLQSFVLGSGQIEGEIQVGNPFGIGSKLNVYENAPEDIKEESILKSELSPNMLDQLKVDKEGPSKSPSPIDGEHVKSKFAEDLSSFKTEKFNVECEPACDGGLPNISAANNAQNPKVKPHMQNSSKKSFPANKQNSAEKVKKILISSVRGSPQMSTPKISKPSVTAVKSATRSLPVSRVKKTAASAPAVQKSPQVLNATRSTLHSVVPSLKPSSLSPSEKGADSLTSRKKIISPGVTQKQTPKLLHTSLNFGSNVYSSISGSIPVTEPRKSLFLEKMGDKDIVKRAFGAFQYMSTSTSLNLGTKATSKKVRNKTDAVPSLTLLEKEEDRMIKKCEVDLKSMKLASTSDKLTHSKEDKRKVKKFAEKTEHQSKSKYKECRETCAGDRRQSLTHKAANQPGLHTGQGLSKSFQDKDVSKSELRQ